MFDQNLEDADILSRFCRYQLVARRNLPIRSSEMGLLIYVSKQAKPITPLSISDFFHISKPTVTELIRSLIGLGYLVKSTSPSDRRSYGLEITKAGRELVETALDAYLRSLEILKMGLGSDDYHTLITIINKANKVLEMETDQ